MIVFGDLKSLVPGRHGGHPKKREDREGARRWI